METIIATSIEKPHSAPGKTVESNRGRHLRNAPLGQMGKRSDSKPILPDQNDMSTTMHP